MTIPSFERGPYSEDQLREIIRRASQHDVHRYSRSEIYRIAAELGISAEAVDAAVTDMGSTNVAAPKPRRLWRSIAAGAALGVISAATMPELLSGGIAEVSGLTFGVMLLIAIRVAQRCGESTRVPVRHFLRRNFVMWGGFMIAGTTVARIFNPDWLGINGARVGLAIAVFWAISSGLGALVAGYRRPPTEPTVPPGIEPASKRGLAARLETLLQRLFGQRYTERSSIPI